MKRKGITLLEVLMAIFIMGIGMVSVFAIFPVAAFMMGQAIERYQINEVVNNAQSNFDPDVLDFVKNRPDWIYLGNTDTKLRIIPNSFLNNSSFVSTVPQYLFLDQAAGSSTRNSLAGVPVAYVKYEIPGNPLTVVFSASLFNERFFTSNYDIEMDESGRAITSVTAAGRYSVSFLLEKKPPFENTLPSRRYMLVFKGRSQTFPDFLGEGLSASTDVASDPNFLFLKPAGTLDYKKNAWIMIHNSATGVRSFHQITAVNTIPSLEIEFQPKLVADLIRKPITPTPTLDLNIITIYLLSDVIRVIDMGTG